MLRERASQPLQRLSGWLPKVIRRGSIPTVPLTIALAALIGVVGGYGAAFFTVLIAFVSRYTVEPIVRLGSGAGGWLAVLWLVPAMGLFAVSWFTRRFAPEAQGHGVPEVILAVARHDGVIRPRVSLVKILASGVCIGTGGSIGREGPIVQIGASFGSMAGQFFKFSSRNIKVLVAAGSAAGISATFHAPLAGVMFACEIILGNFHAESLTPIVIASVLADVVQTHVGEHGLNPAFPALHYRYLGAWDQLPTYALLGLFCGLAAVSFTKMLYFTDDRAARWLPSWWSRALVMGAMVGLSGAFYQWKYDNQPPNVSEAGQREVAANGLPLPPLFGVGYGLVDHALHIENEAKPNYEDLASDEPGRDKLVRLDGERMIRELWWLLPLALLKPILTSMTLAGGGSGGIFAPSLFLGATLGASFGLVANLFFPEWCANPGVYAIVGMGAVVAGTTHGVLSAIFIVYEMTNDYHIILPIMTAAGLSGIVAKLIDPEDIYNKKLSRRGESIARGHDMHRLEDIMVRDVMVTNFPSVRHSDDVTEIVRVARANSHFESLPVMNDEGQLLGIIRPEDLHRVLDSDIPPNLLNAEDVALVAPLAVSSSANLLEALRDFGTRDVETLPVESGNGKSRRLVGLLLRSDVMRRYREEMLRRR